MSNTIENKQNFQKKVLSLKSDFLKIGIAKFPRVEMIDRCPYKGLLKADKWLTKASNIWHLRGVDDDIYNLLVDVYDNENNTRNIEVKE
jgi:hypothetical protein